MPRELQALRVPRVAVQLVGLQALPVRLGAARELRVVLPAQYSADQLRAADSLPGRAPPVEEAAGRPDVVEQSSNSKR
jgi:hypothetical protein